MTYFEHTLETIVAVEMAEAKKTHDEDRMTACLARLCEALGMAIALAANGNVEDTKSAVDAIAQSINNRALACAQMAQLVLAVPENGAKLQ